MNNLSFLLETICDPLEGPFEGEGFWIDSDSTIHVPDNNIKLAATIMRKTNASGNFVVKLVRIGQRGDSIILGFDTLYDTQPVYSKRIGFKDETLVEVKSTEDHRFCLYINSKRATRIFKKLSSAKTFIKKLDQELKEVVVEPEHIEE